VNDIVEPILGSGLFTFKHGNASAIPASAIGFFYLCSNESYGDLIPQPAHIAGRAQAAHGRAD
jgi:hypothetical protein